ncbi:MAG TPA: PPOX class F420-dependent oxidoreductase [Micromonosporaceae bacterium]|nr:PPOX class F420-dependent oxidoreductase [Micromonosporaceae bacterium]
MSIPAEIARSRYVSLTTFRRDGTPVSTPVWHVIDGDELFIVSEAAAGKVKRIRNSGRVVVTVCDIRGRIAPGAPSAEGTARLLDEAATAAGRALLARKYLLSRLGNGLARLLRLRRPPVIGIAVTL